MQYSVPIPGSYSVYDKLVSGLEKEFGSGAAAALAERFIDAEGADFHWEARMREKLLGAYESLETEEELLERVAVLGMLGGRWFVAVLIIGDRHDAQALLGLRHFESMLDAEGAFASVH